MPTDNQFLAAALDLAAKGWPVFPCHPETKRPLVQGDRDPATGELIPNTGGVKKATLDVAQIKEWWKRWPRAMVAIATGEPIGCFVLDLDAGIEEDTGEEFTVERLTADVEAEIGCELPPTLAAATPRGGRHLYFVPGAAEDMPGNRGGMIERVDIRGTGGYVIVPPSTRNDGRTYQWLTPPNMRLARAPAALLDCILRRGKWARGDSSRAETTGDAQASRRISPSPSHSRGSPQSEEEAVRHYGEAALDAEVAELAQARKGTRSDAINRTAFRLGQLVGAGALDEGNVRRAIEDVVKVWPNFKKSQGTLESGLSAGIAEPRDLSDVRAKFRDRTTRAAAFDAAPPPSPSDYGVPRKNGESEPKVLGAAEDDEEADDAEASPEELKEELSAISADTVAHCAGEPANDTGNGRRLLAHFGHDMLHVREVGWHTWAGTHWEREGGDEAVLKLAQKTAARIVLEADYMGATPTEARAIEEGGHAAAELDKLEARRAEWTAEDRTKARQLGDTVDAGKAAKDALSKRKIGRRKFALSSGNGGKLAQMITQALPHNTVPPEALDEDALKFNVLDGTITFRKTLDRECPDPDVKRYTVDVTFTKHTRADMITKVAPVKFNRDAKCPRFDGFLARFQPNEAVREFIQTWFGYCMTGLTGEQSLVFFHGLGANGKSTLVEALCRIFGSYALTLSFESLAGENGRRGDQATPDLARLPGARLVRASEPERGVNFKESLLKSLTGGEPILARHLNEGFFEFRPIFKLVLSGNHKPEIGGVDHGIWRRIRLVPWNVTLADHEMRPQAEILAEFAEEASGILNWLIAGLVNYLKHGLRVPKEITEATEAYREDMDPIGGFARDCIERVAHIDGAPRSSVTARSMYEAFVAWCEANAVRPWKEKSFAIALPQKGFTKTNSRIREYLDVKLVNVPERKAKGHDEPPPPTGDEFPG